MKKRLFFILAATLVLYGAAYYGKISKYDFNPTALTGFGCLSGNASHDICFARLNKTTLPTSSLVFRSGGYDGQFYYYIAAGLNGKGPIYLDYDPIRLARIGYPFLIAWTYALGPWFLIAGMTLLPLTFHLMSILTLFAALQAKDMRMSHERDFQYSSSAKNLNILMILAFNPFSLLCFLLHASDGLALSLAIMGLSMFAIASRDRSRSLIRIVISIGATCAFALSLLTKETMLACVLGLMAMVFLREVLNFPRPISRITRLQFVRSLRLLPIFLVPLVALILWWQQIAFSPLDAREHGSAPFLGFIRYLGSPDAAFSPRGMLLYVMILYLFTIAVQIKKMIRDRNVMNGGAGAFILLITLLLISLASGHEYWSNFANIGRMFAPGVTAYAAIALHWQGDEDSFSILSRRSALFLFVLFSLILIRREYTEASLEYFIF